MTISSPCFPYKFFLATSSILCQILILAFFALKLLISLAAEKDRMSGTMDNYQKIEKIGEGMYFRRDYSYLQPNSRVDAL